MLILYLSITLKLLVAGSLTRIQPRLSSQSLEMPSKLNKKGRKSNLNESLSGLQVIEANDEVEEKKDKIKS
jgi:hypothetical protein